MPQPGAALAQRYELEELDLGGAPGHLWHARQLRSRRRVTVQLLDPAIVEDAVLMEAFLHEASLAAAIDHPNVSRVLDFGIDYELSGGTPFLVLEPLTGETLERRLEQQARLSLPEVARLLSHAALGLHALHERGILHRQLDPAHLLLSDDFASGSFRTGTFSAGSYRVEGTEQEASANTSILFAIEESFRESLSLVHKLSRQLAGVPAEGAARTSDPRRQAAECRRTAVGSYQSPELLLGHGTPDARSDLWSLAVIAFEALTGTPAFGGATLGERLVRVCSGEPAAVPRELALPSGFGDWFERAVRKLPSERFASARELYEAFERLL